MLRQIACVALFAGVGASAVLARPEIPYASLSGSATTVAFDSMAGNPSLGFGEILGAQYASSGVTFNVPNYNAYATNGPLATISTMQSDPNVVWIDQGGGQGGPLAQGMNVVFSVPVRRVGAWMGGSGGSTFSIRAYNGTTLLETVTKPLPPVALSAEGFVAMERPELITRVVMYSTNTVGQNWNFSIDDLKFENVGQCYPDCNQSGSLTIADFACFQAAFASGNPYADCNASGTLTIADFACFQAAFAAGCP